MDTIGGLTKEQFLKMAEQPQPDHIPMIAQSVINAWENEEKSVPTYIVLLLALHIINHQVQTRD